MKKKNKIEQIAIDFLIDRKVDTLPLNALKLACESDILIDSYESFCNYFTNDIHTEGIVIDDLVNEFGNAFVIASTKYKRYAIIYNNVALPREINWAIAHELGHIALGHVSVEQNKINYMASLGTELIEGEAEAFAGYLLSPDLILTTFGISKPDEIAKICYIPEGKAVLKSQQLIIKKQLYTKG